MGKNRIERCALKPYPLFYYQTYNLNLLFLNRKLYIFLNPQKNHPADDLAGVGAASAAERKAAVAATAAAVKGETLNTEP